MDDQNREYEDYEALHDELFALLDQHRMKALSQKLGEMNEFDISEFLGELWEDNPQRMAMVFRILSKEIAAAVKEQLGLELDKKKLQIQEPIKNLGVHEVMVKLHREVTAKLRVHVTEQK